MNAIVQNLFISIIIIWNAHFDVNDFTKCITVYTVKR